MPFFLNLLIYRYLKQFDKCQNRVIETYFLTFVKFIFQFFPYMASKLPL